eukprot:MONOS_1856.1-p1 / transcript=MONOS_1856.1 / gene=MONOS_1856 / organism=Monocercomonoides_exilis_PA203 / gene_product=unspecified product / transcript_product=unspecified product / location=Mono_scaffold00035:53808-54334(+) / protein_length=109 / sequence_SO=supercontig / SO=protein_coding / is_pseudo=false
MSAEALHTLSKKVGDTFTIEFPSNPSTGYTWSLVEPEGNAGEILELVEDKFISSVSNRDPNAPRKVGAPGTHQFTFRALKSGTNDFEFIHHRPWEQKNPAPEVYRITID